MDAAQIPIKINQTKQSDGGKQMSNTVTEAPTIPFNQILAMFNGSGQTAGQGGKPVEDAEKTSGKLPDVLKPGLEDLQKADSVLTSWIAGLQQMPPLTTMSVPNTAAGGVSIPNDLTAIPEQVHNENNQALNQDLTKSLELGNSEIKEFIGQQMNSKSNHISIMSNPAISNNPVHLAVDSLLELAVNISNRLTQNQSSTNNTGVNFLVDIKNIGQVHLEMVSFEGQASLKFTTENPDAGDMLQNQLHLLEQMLEQRGVKMEKLEIVNQPSVLLDPSQYMDNQLSISVKNPKRSVQGSEQTGTSINAEDVAGLNESANPVSRHSYTSAGADKVSSEQSRPIISIPQFVPEVNNWIGRNLGALQSNGGTREVKFLLSPEHLGQIEVKIISQDGQVSAQIITDTLQSKELLDGQLHHLKQALQQQGLTIQKLEIVQQQPMPVDSAQLNQAFSQGGFHPSQEDRSAPSAKNGLKKQKESEQSELEMESQFITYSGTSPRTASTIDFTA